MLLTWDYYQAITGDTTTDDAAFASAASSAQDLVEDALDRVGHLEQAERTETLEVGPDGVLYPTATPLVDVPGYATIGDVVYGASSDLSTWVGLLGSSAPATVELTYTGGYTSDTAPEYLLRDLAAATYAILHPPDLSATSAIPANATSASVGDVSLGFGAAGAGGSSASLLPSITWSAQTMQLREVEP